MLDNVQRINFDADRLVAATKGIFKDTRYRLDDDPSELYERYYTDMAELLQSVYKKKVVTEAEPIKSL